MKYNVLQVQYFKTLPNHYNSLKKSHFRDEEEELHI